MKPWKYHAYSLNPIIICRIISPLRHERWLQYPVGMSTVITHCMSAFIFNKNISAKNAFRCKGLSIIELWFKVIIFTYDFLKCSYIFYIVCDVNNVAFKTLQRQAEFLFISLHPYGTISVAQCSMVWNWQVLSAGLTLYLSTLLILFFCHLMFLFLFFPCIYMWFWGAGAFGLIGRSHVSFHSDINDALIFFLYYVYILLQYLMKLSTFCSRQRLNLICIYAKMTWHMLICQHDLISDSAIKISASV